MRRVLLPIVWCLACVATPTFAADGIHRCIGEGGVSIYTDQPCDTFGAVDRKPVAAADGRSEIAPSEAASDADKGFTRADCVRRTDTLLFELRRAIESQDVNQLAGLYHWPGIGSRASRGILDRLERIVARPLASAELVFPEPAPPTDEAAWYPDMAADLANDPSADQVAGPVQESTIDASTDAMTGAATASSPDEDAPVRSEQPVAVHIEQTLPGDISPSFAEDLRLVRYAECWWLRF